MTTISAAPKKFNVKYNTTFLNPIPTQPLAFIGVANVHGPSECNGVGLVVSVLNIGNDAGSIHTG